MTGTGSCFSEGELSGNGHVSSAGRPGLLARSPVGPPASASGRGRWPRLQGRGQLVQMGCTGPCSPLSTQPYITNDFKVAGIQNPKLYMKLSSYSIGWLPQGQCMACSSWLDAEVAQLQWLVWGGKVWQAAGQSCVH